MTPAQRELLDNANAVILGLQRAIAEHVLILQGAMPFAGSCHDQLDGLEALRKNCDRMRASLRMAVAIRDRYGAAFS